MAKHRPKFIDLFAGCGGLSLGLLQAGWSGHFAIEKNADAFLTLKTNLVEKTKRHRPAKCRFEWPAWLPVEELTIQNFLSEHVASLRDNNEQVDLVVGGPPCQGFSFAGRREASDPRNKLFKEYLKFVSLNGPGNIVAGYGNHFGTNLEDQPVTLGRLW